jgi:hypothetical protein
MRSDSSLSLAKGAVTVNEDGNVQFDISTDADDVMLIQFHVNGKMIEVKEEDKDFIYNMSPGDYRIMIKCEGSSPWEKTVTIVEGGETQLFVVELAVKNVLRTNESNETSRGCAPYGS